MVTHTIQMGLSKYVYAAFITVGIARVLILLQTCSYATASYNNHVLFAIVLSDVTYMCHTSVVLLFFSTARYLDSGRFCIYVLHTQHEAVGKLLTDSADCGVDGLTQASFCPKPAPEISLSSTDEAALAGSSLDWRSKAISGLQPRALQKAAQMP